MRLRNLLKTYCAYLMKTMFFVIEKSIDNILKISPEAISHV